MKRPLALFLVAIVLVVSGTWHVHNLVGTFLWDTFRADRAAAFLSADNALLMLDIGNYYFNVGGEGVYDLERAQFYFQKALAADPLVPDAWHQLARIDFLNGDYPAARSKINTQIELHSDTLTSSYYIRGLIAGFQKDYEQAEKDFRRFLEWDPKNWAAHNDLAWIYFAQGKFSEAADIAHDGLRFDTRNPWLLTARGVALLNLGNTKEALALIANAKYYASRLDPADWQHAYPGNDPQIAPSALQEMRTVIDRNLALLVDKSAVK